MVVLVAGVDPWSRRSRAEQVMDGGSKMTSSDSSMGLSSNNEGVQGTKLGPKCRDDREADCSSWRLARVAIGVVLIRVHGRIYVLDIISLGNMAGTMPSAPNVRQ